MEELATVVSMVAAAAGDEPDRFGMPLDYAPFDSGVGHGWSVPLTVTDYVALMAAPSMRCWSTANILACMIQMTRGENQAATRPSHRGRKVS